MKISCLQYYWTLLVATIMTVAANAQVVCDKMFIKEYSASGHIEPFATKNLPNDEILIAGKASTSATGTPQLMVVKLSSTGAVLWSKLLGGVNNDKFTGIVLLSDNSYLFYGITASNGYTNGKVLLTRMTANGNLVWSRLLGDASTSGDRIKAVRQAADGDIIGTFNINDSSDLSDPVVFKMGLDGTIRWARRFNNSGDDSFTSIAEDNNQVFVSGYSTVNTKAAVLMILNSNNGNLISSRRPYHFDTSFDQELANLEVFDGKMSFALWTTKYVNSSRLGTTLLMQMDMAGNKLFETKASITGGPTTEFFRRSKDNGFFLLGSAVQYGTAPVIIKTNRYNTIEWSAVQSQDRWWFQQQNHGFDITSTNGTVSAGYYQNYTTNNLNRMKVVRTGETGTTGSTCTIQGNTFFVDTVTLFQSAFTWASAQTETIGLNEPLALQESVYPMIKEDICDSTACVDHTPLPPLCNKTMLVEYGGKSRTTFRDAVTTTDGGKIVVGELAFNGLVVKINNNGDIAWSKKYDEVGHNMMFHRVIKSGANHVLAFANNYWVVDHGANTNVKAVKLDLNGNVVFSKDISRYGAELADVFTLPDGGFVAAFNELWGIGYLYLLVVRFDKDANVVWKKEVTYPTSWPVYRSLYCTDNSIYIGHDVYDQANQDKVGVQKLDLATGNNVWSKRYALDAEALRFNRIYVLNDTLYSFINRQKEIGFFEYDYRIAMLRLRSDGSIINSVLFNTDNMVLPDSYHFLDYTSPTVTFTPDSNFVLCHAIETQSGDKGLNITRFDKNGNGLWSKNYSGLNAHRVINIHTQDSGLVVMGVVVRPTSLDSRFTNGFLLKTDNKGEIIGTASGICKTQAAPFSKSPIMFEETDPRVDGVIDAEYLSVEPSNVVPQNVYLDATLYCNQVAYCSSMELAGDASSCKLKDTLTFYITSNNCGAVTKWTYDTAYFAFVAKVGDTLRLSGLKPGSSTINAEIESPCSIVFKSLPVSVLISASNLNLGKDTTVCPGTALALNAGSGYQSYHWNDGSSDSRLKITSPGLYSVTVTDYCGGTATDEIMVENVAHTFKINGPAEKCNNDTIALTVPPGFKQYQWTSAGSLQFVDHTAKVFPAQTTTYYAQAETIGGCMLKDSLIVTVKTSPQIDLGEDAKTCFDQSVTLVANPVFINYSWNTGDQTASITAEEGTYIVNATYSNNCISRDTIVISKYPFTHPNLGRDTSLCAETEFRLNPGSYQQYLWNDNSTKRQLTVKMPGLYWVMVTDNNGCSANDTIRIVNVYPQPANFLVDTISICWGDARSVKPDKEFSRYTWSTGTSSNTISVIETGTYYLTVTDANGCTGNDTLRVSQKQDCPNRISFYNAFTPNNDGKNDAYKPVVTGNVEKYSLTIYNRNGEIVFASKDPRVGWNGIFKGVEQSSAAFIFVCRYKFYGIDEVKKTGTLVLIR